MGKFIQKHAVLLLIIFFCFMLFSPGLTQFFLSDDWFHLKIVQISNVKEFLNFFSPLPNAQSTAFYRPIPNQLFFYIFYQLFGLQAFFYHFFVFILFAYSLYLYYLFLSGMGLSKRVVLMSTFVVAFSHTYFTRLYFLSAAQEIMMSVFVLLGLISNQKKEGAIKNFVSAGWFILALLCKDSAIVFPALVVIFDWMQNKKFYTNKILLLAFVSLTYLFIRVFIFGFSSTLAGHESYLPSFSPRVLLNTFYQYVIWAFGGAELLQDYLSSPLKLIPRYYTDFGLLGKTMIVFLFSTIFLTVLIFFKNVRNFTQKNWLGVAVFVVAILPVIFFPSHKFTIQMSLSMFGFALFVGILLAKESKKVIALFLLSYFCLNIVSILLTQNTHYTVQRSRISEKVYEYMIREYPSLPSGTTVVFLNSQTVGSDIVTWGSSKQISHALMGDNFFRVVYPESEVTVLYEDMTDTIKKDTENTIYLSSSLFLE